MENIENNSSKALISNEELLQNLKILRRDDQTLVRFNPIKIARAIEKAFRASLTIEGDTPDDVMEWINSLTVRVSARAEQRNVFPAALFGRVA